MPTGYTAYIENGDITTGKDFLKLCTRAFGIAIDQKDEPLSVPTKTEFEPNSYYIKSYNKACEKLQAVKNISFSEAKLKLKDQHNKRIKDYIEIAENYSSLRDKYLKVRSEVESWSPPTLEHNGVKKFALEQIDMCIPSEDTILEYINKSKEPLDLSDSAVQQFINDSISHCEDDVKYYKKLIDEEYERTHQKQDWMDQFLRSLENI